MLTPTEQYTVDVLHAGSVSAGNKQTNSKLLETASTIRSKMMLGLTIAPALASATYVDSVNKNYTTVQVASDNLLPRVDVVKSVPTIYIEGGVMCCDTRRDEPVADYAQIAELNAVATEVFKGTQPLRGIAYNHLSRLVSKNAKQQSSIAGML